MDIDIRGCLIVATKGTFIEAEENRVTARVEILIRMYVLT